MVLTRRQFQGLLKERGYTQAEVARLWGITPARLSQVVHDSARSPLYEYALWGLPPKRTAPLVAARREQAARTAELAAPTRQPPLTKTLDEDPWADMMAIGAVFIVSHEQGEHLPEGCEGTVIAHEERRGVRHVTIHFATGYRERFGLTYLRDPQCFLTFTGRIADQRT